MKILVKYGAQFETLSKIIKKIRENVLEVSVRWNHQDVLRFFLSAHEWPKKYVKKAIKSADNKLIKGLLKGYLKNPKKFLD